METDPGANQDGSSDTGVIERTNASALESLTARDSSDGTARADQIADANPKSGGEAAFELLLRMSEADVFAFEPVLRRTGVSAANHGFFLAELTSRD